MTPPHKEYKVVEALKKLRNDKVAGATGFKAEHIKQWYEDAKAVNDD